MTYSTLRGWGSVIRLFSLEVIICTPAHSGLQFTALVRGQAQGDAPKTNLKQKQNKIDSNNNLIALTRPFWAGGFVALGIVASLFLNAPQAHAAIGWSDSMIAQKVLADATPLAVANNQPTESINPTASSADDFIEKPFVAETKITPPDPPKVLASSYRRTPADYSLVTGPHYFPYGYCTYYVSQKRTISWSGNAGTWLSGAKSFGYSIGDEPKPGAILVTAEGGRAGHVAYVESVNADSFTVSEMNYKGYGIVSSRTIPDSYGAIKGFIY